MTNMQPPLPLAQPSYTNRRLFSDYYLDRILPESPYWQALIAQAEPIRGKLQTIFAAFTPTKNEAQTEQDCVRPVLDALGHAYNVQPSLKTADGPKKPDYVLYGDAMQANADKGRMLDDTLPRHGGLAVADAKYWERPLDQAIRDKNADALSNKNPAYQIYFYVQQSGVAWGILTNGKLWRLVHKDTAHKLDCYYEVDLPDLLEHGSDADFLYFYAFFSRAAFDSASPIGIVNILKQSAEYALGVGETLKTQVYEALRHIAQGFLDFDGNQLPADPETLKEIYDNALILLYRLLFILYAEGRGLLPVTASAMYRDTYGLHAIKQEMARRIDSGKLLLPTTDTLWPDLKRLFGFIDKGEPPLKIATFNGGLFDPAKHPFLEKYTVGDSHLMQAIDRLARVPRDGQRQFIDYRDLAVRHLGTIYEGLLEFHLSAAAPEPGWNVSLLNDKGERKASGSYYTPDAIVKYIVEQTVGPLLDRIAADKSDVHARAEAILNVKVLDPAMGSGHFLVEAVEYIARYLVNLTPDEAGDAPSHDLTYWKRRVAQSCIYGVDLNPLAVELAQLSLWLTTIAQDLPLSFLGHHLRPGNALVGARLDDLQFSGQSQAKKKRKRVADEQEAQGQTSMMDDNAFRQSMSVAVGNMWLIEENEGRSVTQVKQQEQLYNDLRKILTGKFGSLANLVTADHFGIKINPKLRTPLADYATGRNIAALPEIADILTAANALAEDRLFFHWELEFPEVFFDRFGRPLSSAAGFDAVIGNPPYFNMQTADTDFSSYVQAAYPEYYRGKADVYYYFMALALKLTRLQGAWSFITARYYLESHYADRLWTQLITRTNVLRLADFGPYKIFPEASVDVCIIRSSNAHSQTAANTWMTKALAADLTDAEVRAVLTESSENIDILARVQAKTVDVNTLRRTSSDARALSQLCFVGKGAASGNDNVFVVDSQTVHKFGLEAAVLQEIVEDDTIERYGHASRGRYLIVVKRGTDISAFPNTQNYLQAHKSLLEARYAVVNEGVKWYEIVRYNTDLFDLTSPQIYAYYRSQGGKFSYSTTNFCTLTTTFVIVPKHNTKESPLFLLSLLNSEFLQKHYFAKFGKVMGGVVEYSANKLNDVPIPSINFCTPDAVRQQLSAKGIAYYKQKQYEDVLNLAGICLAVAPSQSDVVHDILAHLAQQMLDLNKQRQDAVDALVLDLEGYLASAQLQKIARLWTPPTGNKTMPDEARQMLGDMASRHLDLRANIGAISETQWKWLLKQRLSKIASLADLVAVYRRRQPAIAAIDARLEATDRLIDSLVYALYNLTPDEINTIETRLVPHASASDASE